MVIPRLHAPHASGVAESEGKINPLVILGVKQSVKYASEAGKPGSELNWCVANISLLVLVGAEPTRNASRQGTPGWSLGKKQYH